MADKRLIRELLDAIAYDANGQKLGKVSEVYLNDNTSLPDFVEIRRGILGREFLLVPLRGHSLEVGKLHLAFPLERISDAPDIEAETHLANEAKENLYAHFGIAEIDTATTPEDTTPDNAQPAQQAQQTHEAAEAEAQCAGPESTPADPPKIEKKTVGMRKFVIHNSKPIEVNPGDDATWLGGRR